MAFATKTTNNENKRVYMDVKSNGAEVTSARVISESCVIFTLKCKGFSFYSLRLMERKSDKKLFISVPQTKGKDGKYYDNYGLYLSDADREVIINKVLEKVQNEE